MSKKSQDASRSFNNQNKLQNLVDTPQLFFYYIFDISFSISAHHNIHEYSRNPHLGFPTCDIKKGFLFRLGNRFRNSIPDS